MADNPNSIKIDPIVCIHSMPDEILLRIMKFACEAEEISNEQVQYPTGFWDRYTKVCHSMALVDRRFHRIVTPLLYYYVCIDAPYNYINEYWPRVSNLYRTVKETPALRVHVRRLEIYFPGPAITENTSFLHELRFIALWLPNLAFLATLDGDAEYVMELIVDTLANLSSLTCLSINGLDGDLDIGSIFTTLNGSCMIDKLAIDQKECLLDYSDTDHDIAPFTQLEFVCHYAPGGLLSDLLKWPSTLHSVILRESCDCIDMFGTDLSVVIRALSTHKNTLKKLDVGSVCTILNPDRHSIGISSLPALEEFTISRWCFSADLKFSRKLVERLLGPSLCNFTWSIEPALGAEPDDAGIALSDMGPDEEEWLVAFGTFAAQQKGLSKLQRIHVRFTPRRFFRPEHSLGRIAVWPWDRLRNVKKRLAPQGIEVTYSKPTYTKKEWQRSLDFEMK